MFFSPDPIIYHWLRQFSLAHLDIQPIIAIINKYFSTFQPCFFIAARYESARLYELYSGTINLTDPSLPFLLHDITKTRPTIVSFHLQPCYIHGDFLQFRPNSANQALYKCTVNEKPVYVLFDLNTAKIFFTFPDKVTFLQKHTILRLDSNTNTLFYEILNKRNLNEIISSEEIHLHIDSPKCECIPVNEEMFVIDNDNDGLYLCKYPFIEEDSVVTFLTVGIAAAIYVNNRLLEVVAWKNKIVVCCRMGKNTDGFYGLMFYVYDVERFEWVEKTTLKGIEKLDRYVPGGARLIVVNGKLGVFWKEDSTFVNCVFDEGDRRWVKCGHPKTEFFVESTWRICV